MDENRFYGYWRIKEMEMWDQDFIDAEVPGYIQFDDDEMGEFQFGYVHGFMDCRLSTKNEKDFVEFSWEGNDESVPFKKLSNFHFSAAHFNVRFLQFSLFKKV